MQTAHRFGVRLAPDSLSRGLGLSSSVSFLFYLSFFFSFSPRPVISFCPWQNSAYRSRLRRVLFYCLFSPIGNLTDTQIALCKFFFVFLAFQFLPFFLLACCNLLVGFFVVVFFVSTCYSCVCALCFRRVRLWLFKELFSCRFATWLCTSAASPPVFTIPIYLFSILLSFLRLCVRAHSFEWSTICIWRFSFWHGLAAAFSDATADRHAGDKSTQKPAARQDAPRRAKSAKNFETENIYKI